ncbi:ComEC/Rec2 family competence protein [Flavihumibacter cheonanensis]|uniref:ComEC/Rec2 family competence protein n=1 Tax=Flavihumibacter cheonanensis TaxID=1442385 RepID=UPI001EF8966E|nr:ComEC/Rec2 family competence protein [Flavihumibacter cheonanensis]MCG7753399.1 competence protein ComEC family protein [Flavihumibacter cheonanensis]
MQKDAAPWLAAPFIRLVLPFLGGIWLGETLLPHRIVISSTIAIVFLSGCFLLHQLMQKQLQAFNLLFGCCLQFFLLSLGWTSLLLHDIRYSPNWIGHQLNQQILVVAEPEALPALGAKSARFTMQVKSVITRDGINQYRKGRFLLYLPKDQSGYLQPGSTYLLPADRLKKLIPNRNPGSFDFAVYNHKKNIFHQLYLDSSQLVAFPSSYENRYRTWLTSAQQVALEAMDTSIPVPHNQLAKALLIGYREEVDKELLDTYSQTGVVHVIAVSGMHLGLIFLILQRILLFPESRFPFTKWIKFLLVVVFTWFFAAVAGSAGSIIRAASMFSFILFAKLLRKPVNSFQSISLTAFILLLIDPNWLWDAGFLLSFAALLSIVLYQKSFFNLVAVQNPIMNAVWELSAVTIAAQILTIPICILLFHQLPVYFLPANLMAVPLSSMALIGTLALWMTAAIGFTIPFLGTLTGYFIHWMNLGIELISRLPGALIHDINWTHGQVTFAYVLLVMMTGWLKSRQPRLIFLSLVSLTGFLSLGLVQKWNQEKQELILLHHLPGKSILTIISGTTAHFFLNRFSPPRHKTLDDTRRHLGIETSHYTTASIINFENQLLALPRNNGELAQYLLLDPDYLLLNRQISSIKSLLNKSPKGTILLIDGSIPESRAAQWHTALTRAGYRVHSTWQEGAFCQSVSTILPNPIPEK